MALISESKHIRVQTALGDALGLVKLEGTEGVSQLFRFDLELRSEDTDIDPNQLVGAEAAVVLGLRDQGERFFHGVLSEFRHVGHRTRHSHYRARMRPWLWLLTRRRNCRAYQDKTVPDILQSLLGEYGYPLQLHLSRSYRTWHYCVQYRETDFAFVSRLMEQEGIYYYFEHEADRHKLVLCDAVVNHDPMPGFETIPHRSPGTSANSHVREQFWQEQIWDWEVGWQVHSGAFAHRDYNFTSPSSDLETKASAPRGHSQAEIEVYDYPGEYADSGEGQDYADTRMEELAANHQSATGRTDCRGIAPGHTFTLEDHRRADQNREWLCLEASYEMDAGESEATDRRTGPQFQARFRAIPADQQYRPPRTTPRPVVEGPQTAVVCGSGEIDVDEYARVPVRFHWYRSEGPMGNTSSVYIRVSQLHAGRNFGGIDIPRVGEEVIVSFLEGDPDQPIVTGRVYNADNMPPYELPANKTQSGVKTRSTEGGGEDNFNEIRFEDKIGAEEMYLHAEKDQNTVVENNQGIVVGVDREEHIGQDRLLTVGRDKTEEVAANKTIEVGGMHEETIGASQTISVGANLSESVAQNYSETVGIAMQINVGGVMSINVGAAHNLSVGGASIEGVGGSKSESIGGSKTSAVAKGLITNVGAKRESTVAKDDETKIGGQYRLEAAKEGIIQAKKLQFAAKDEILLKCGKAEILMKKSGDITIKGKKMTLKASSNMILKGSTIKEN